MRACGMDRGGCPLKEAFVILRVVATTLALGFLTALAGMADSTPESLIKAGHWKRARPLVEQSYRANPNNAKFAYLLSQVKLTYGDLDTALSLAEKSVALDPKNSGYHYQLAITCGRTAEKATLFTKGHWAKRFKEEAETAASLDAKNLDARFGLLEYYLQAPRLMGGGKDKARTMADEIGKIDLTSGELAQARVAEDQKNRSKERDSYARAVAAGPKTYEARISIANFYLRSAASSDNSRNQEDGGPPADPVAAEKYAREAAKLEPDRVDAYSVLARLYSMQKRWTDLDSVLGEGEKKIPDDLSPYHRAAQVLLAQSPDGSKDLTRAERYFRKYLSQDPEADSPSLAETHWRLGLVLEDEGRKGEAMTEIETAIRMDPNLEKANVDLKRIRGGVK
jgi:Tetratricopeptide repeat